MITPFVFQAYVGVDAPVPAVNNCDEAGGHKLTVPEGETVAVGMGKIVIVTIVE